MCLRKIFDGKGKQHMLDSEKIGNLEELSTHAKDSLVAAVNEVDGRVPRVTAENEGAFVRVVDGALTVQQMTDVSKEGA